MEYPQIITEPKGSCSVEAYIQFSETHRKQLFVSVGDYYQVCEPANFSNGYAVVTVGQLESDDDVCYYFYVNRAEAIVNEEGETIVGIEAMEKGKITMMEPLIEEVKKKGSNILHLAKPEMLLTKENTDLLRLAMKEYLVSIKEQGVSALGKEVDKFNKHLEDARAIVFPNRHANLGIEL